MKKYLNLLEYELKHCRNFLLVTILAVTLFESIVFFQTISQRMASYGTEFSLTLSEVFDNNFLYSLVIGGAIMALLAYSVLTWTREWMQDGKFIYRLASLPGSRLPIALAKLTTIFVMIFSLLLVQVVLIILFNRIAVSTGAIKESISWYHYLQQTSGISYRLIPTSFPSFALTYSYGGAGLLVLFNVVILFMVSRSTAWMKRIFTIGLYIMTSIVGLVLIRYLDYDVLQLLPSEWFIRLCLIIIYNSLQVWVMKYILDQRMNV